MIAKNKQSEPASNRFERSGAAAEAQMAYYLARNFADAEDIFVINDLRLIEGDNCAQIDHLVLHTYGIRKQALKAKSR